MTPYSWNADVSSTRHHNQGLQAMDNSHVALVTVHLDADQFEFYRCDRNMPLGVNVGAAAEMEV